GRSGCADAMLSADALCGHHGRRATQARRLLCPRKPTCQDRLLSELSRQDAAASRHGERFPPGRGVYPSRPKPLWTLTRWLIDRMLRICLSCWDWFSPFSVEIEYSPRSLSKMESAPSWTTCSAAQGTQRLTKFALPFLRSAPRRRLNR